MSDLFLSFFSNYYATNSIEMLSNFPINKLMNCIFCVHLARDDWSRVQRPGLFDMALKNLGF